MDDVGKTGVLSNVIGRVTLASSRHTSSTSGASAMPRSQCGMKAKDLGSSWSLLNAGPLTASPWSTDRLGFDVVDALVRLGYRFGGNFQAWLRAVEHHHSLIVGEH